MAMEDITAKLGLDDSAFTRGLGKVENGLTLVKGSVVGLNGAIQRAQGLFAGLFAVEVIRRAIDFGSAISDTSERTRTLPEALQVLQANARETGVPLQTLEKALVRTTTAAEEAATSVSGPLRDAFSTLNINLQAFTALKPEDRLAALGKAYLDTGKTAQGFAAITAILGEKAGPKLIEMLKNLGDQGLAAIREEMIKTGQVLSDLDVQKLDKLGDTLSAFKTRAMVIFSEVITGIDDLWKKLKGEGIMPEETRATNAQLQAVREVVAARNGVIPQRTVFGYGEKKFPAVAQFDVERRTRPGMVGFSEGELKNILTPEERIKVESRTEQILGDIAAKSIADRATAEKKQLEADAAEKVRNAKKVADTIAEAEATVARKSLSDSQQKLELERQINEEKRKSVDPTLTPGDQQAAATRAAKLITEAGTLKAKMAADEEKIADRVLKLTQERLKFEREQLPLREQILATEAEIARLKSIENSAVSDDKARADTTAKIVALEERRKQLKADIARLSLQVADFDNVNSAAEKAGYEAARKNSAQQLSNIEKEIARLRLLQTDPKLSEDKRIDNAKTLLDAQNDLLGLLDKEKRIREAQNERLGFSFQQAVSGERGGGAITPAAQRANRQQNEAERLSDRAARLRAQANSTDVLDLGNGETGSRFSNSDAERQRLLNEADAADQRARDLDQKAGKARDAIPGLKPSERRTAEDDQKIRAALIAFFAEKVPTIKVKDLSTK